MGIADLWPAVDDAVDARTSMACWTAQFMRLHGRPPRLALDFGVLVFRSAVDIPVDTVTIRNVLSRCLHLTSLGVSYVVVFDGRLRPKKRRNNVVLDHSSYDQMYLEFCSTPVDSYSDDSFPLANQCKSVFSEHGVSWAQAPGEAEAECVHLQKLGIVDYIVSDDSDVFVFGATHVLRDFSAEPPESGANLAELLEVSPSKGSPTKSSTKYYVTPVTLDNIIRKYGLTTNRLVLVAVLRGGDYSDGTRGIGITQAVKIAQCGTKHANYKASPSKYGSIVDDDPDFASDFVECLVEYDPAHQLVLKQPQVRQEKLEAFKTALKERLEFDSRAIFGRYKRDNSIEIDELHALMYLRPLVNEAPFKFTKRSLSFSEIPVESRPPISSDVDYSSYSSLDVTPQWLPESCSAIRFLLVRLISYIDNKGLLEDFIRIEMRREFPYNLSSEGKEQMIDFARVRYKPRKLESHFFDSRMFYYRPSKQESELIWLPTIILRYFNPVFVDRSLEELDLAEKQAKIKKLPKRLPKRLPKGTKAPPQKNTLFSMGFLSPQKSTMLSPPKSTVNREASNSTVTNVDDDDPFIHHGAFSVSTSTQFERQLLSSPVSAASVIIPELKRPLSSRESPSTSESYPVRTKRPKHKRVLVDTDEDYTDQDSLVL